MEGRVKNNQSIKHFGSTERQFLFESMVFFFQNLQFLVLGDRRIMMVPSSSFFLDLLSKGYFYAYGQV